mgnify:CR=1 FL=1
MWTISSVEDISQDMETVDGQSLNQVTECNDKIVCPTGADSGIDDLIEPLWTRKKLVVI